MVEQYLKANENLKQEWKNKRPDGCMIWDGIICPEKWFASDLKLMFIAKEAYSKGGEPDWDIAIEGWCEADGLFYVGSNANQATQNNIARWAYAIHAALHGKESISIKEAEQDDFKACRPIMLDSAYINIKKAGGHSSSNDNDLRRIADEDKDLLKNQIEMINPNVFYLCSTHQYLDKIFAGATKIEGTNICYDWNGKLLIGFYHPGSRIGKEESINTIFENVKKISNKEKYLK